MDIRKVKKLIEMLEGSSLNEIVIKEGEESVKLVKSAGLIQHAQVPAPISPPPSIPSVLESSPEDKKENSENIITSGKSITSPMVGTYYSPPNPGADSFVKVGDSINE